MDETTPAPSPESPESRTDEPADAEALPLKERVIGALKTVFDPEIPVNIYELGLVYTVEVDEETGKVFLEMTLTSPNCPVAGTLPGDVEMRVKRVEGVTAVKVDLVWDPPWSMERLSDAAKLQLGFM